MNMVKKITAGILLCTTFSQANDAFSAFTLGYALPLGGASAVTAGSPKKLAPGLDIGWTFCGRPFASMENPLANLALGGKISYGSWVRDSTYNPVNLLGMQGVARYYALPQVKPVDLFLQASGGMFIGEYGFTSPDTLNRSIPSGKTIKGRSSMGLSLGLGMNWDVIEILPVYTIVLTAKKASAWLSLSAGIKI